MKKSLFVFTALLLFSCSKDASESNPFIGIWKNDEIGGQKLTIQFNSTAI